MTIVNFNFNKVLAEFDGFAKGKTKKIDINTTININKITEIDIVLGKTKEKGLRIDFSYITKYEPNIGKILLEGLIVLIEKQDNIKKIKEMWEKEKRLPDVIMTYVLNEIMRRANVEAILLSREVGLPLPVRLPRIRIATKQKKGEDKEDKKEDKTKK